MSSTLDRRRLVFFLAAAMSGGMHAGAKAQGAAASQTLTGAAAQKSPQADVFLAYETALIDGGLEAAEKYASPAKVKDNQEMVKAFGLEGFKQMQAERRKNRLSPAERRKQILKVVITGDYAYLEATSERPPLLDVAGFVKTPEGWKVAPVRR